MTTQITTLEQAELTLRRNNAVVLHNEQQMVEGKQLLNICGFNYARPNDGIREQINRHNFVSGVDFMREEDLTHSGRGQRPVLYHFTVNAANHILLAAMTNEGRDARQEAIDMRAQQEEVQPMTHLQVLSQIVTSMVDMEQRQIAQQQALETKADKADVERLSQKVDSRGCHEGYILISDAYRKYKRGLSKNVFKEVLAAMEVPMEGIYITLEGGVVSQTNQVQEDRTREAIDHFYTGIERASQTRYSHPLFGTKKFQA